MGTEYYLVDFVGRNVLDMHKSYWLLDIEDCDRVTANDIRRCATDCPDGWAGWLDVVALRWIEEIAQGRPVALRSEYSYDVAPWTGEDLGGLAEGWSGYTPWREPRAEYGGEWQRYGTAPRDEPTRQRRLVTVPLVSTAPIPEWLIAPPDVVEAGNRLRW